jgi:hypothetical protein
MALRSIIYSVVKTVFVPVGGGIAMLQVQSIFWRGSLK